MVAPRFAAIIPVGPGEIEMARTLDLLDSLWHYEPHVRWVVAVDDVPGHLDVKELQSRAPEGCHVHVIDNPRAGRGNGHREGLFVGVVEAMAWIQRDTDAQLSVKLDTDALVIGSFSEVLGAFFGAHPGVGQVGTFDVSCDGTRREDANAERWVHARAKLVRVWRGGRLRAHVEVAGSGWRRRLRQRIRAARANGYRDGTHCQGGAYALSRATLDRLHAAGDLANPVQWLPAAMPEDVLMTILVQATQLSCAGLAGRGEPFGVTHRGLPYPPPELVERGYSIIHSVKDHLEFSEDATRQFFRSRRTHIDGATDR